MEAMCRPGTVHDVRPDHRALCGKVAKRVTTKDTEGRKDKDTKKKSKKFNAAQGKTCNAPFRLRVFLLRDLRGDSFFRLSLSKFTADKLPGAPHRNTELAPAT